MKKGLVCFAMVSIIIISGYTASADDFNGDSWGDIDEMWLLKPMAAQFDFNLYEQPLKTSAVMGTVKKGSELYCLDIKRDMGWCLLRQINPPYKKGWGKIMNDSEDYAIENFYPRCSVWWFSEEAIMSNEPYLYCNKEEMPFYTLLVDVTDKNIGHINDARADLDSKARDDMGYNYICDYPGDKEGYCIGIGLYKDIADAQKHHDILREHGYDSFIARVEYADGNIVVTRVTDQKEASLDHIISIVVELEVREMNEELESWIDPKILQEYSDHYWYIMHNLWHKEAQDVYSEIFNRNNKLDESIIAFR